MVCVDGFVQRIGPLQSIVSGQGMLTPYAQVVLSGLLVRCPQIPFAKDAYEQLNVGCDLFARVATGFGDEKTSVS
jgi:hypothetical protein